MSRTARLFPYASSAIVFVASGALFAACGASKSGDGGSTDAGDDASAATSLTYAPQGCAYTVTPPPSRGFVDLALDDGSGDLSAPTRVRLGLGGGTTAGAPGYADPSSTVAFTWETPTKNRAAKVRIGTDPGALGDVHAGYAWTTPPPTVGIGRNEGETYMHEVHVCGLKPATTYYYQVGGGPAGGEQWSATQSFTTAPTSGPIRVAVFGDARDQVATWQQVHTRVLDAKADLALVSGDLVDFGTQESLYAQWLDAIWKDPRDASKFLTLGQLLIVPIAGNHENDSSQFYGNFALPGDGAYAEQFFSFDLGSAHIAFVDDQAVATAPQKDAAKATLAWLDADLAKASGAARASHPFLVLVSHRGLFSSSKHMSDEDVVAARAALAPLVDKYGVDLVLNGHEHEYESSKPLRAGSDPSGAPVVQSDPTKGAIYVVNAGAGADAYGNGADPGWRAKAAAYGDGTPYVGCYGILTIDDHALKLESYMMKPGAGPDDLVDTVTRAR